jgi:pimeloyl-ACP methyl ester carboxylesterase
MFQFIRHTPARAFLALLALLLLPGAAQAESERMISVGDISIAVQEYGRKSDPPIVLVAGTGMQLVEWPDALVKGLVDQRRRVVLFDNRDAGLSTHFTSAGMPDFAAVLGAVAKGQRPDLPYTADHLAADVIGVMDALHIDQADLLGISGGATIAQLVTLKAPARVSSLILIAANSGNPALPLPANPERLHDTPSPQQTGNIGQMIEDRVKIARLLAGRDEGFDSDLATKNASRALSRDRDAFAHLRQGITLLVLGDIRARIAEIRAPTVVLHGINDPLISIAAGNEVSNAIPGARFYVLEGMGHNLPTASVLAILDKVEEVAAKTDRDR